MQANPSVDPRLLMQAQAMMGGPGGPPLPQGHGGPRPLPPSTVPRFMSPEIQAAAHLASGPSNQGSLSRFFSPEVLAQAQSGNVPPLPPLPTQKAMTLEEIERHAAAVRM